MSRAGRCLNIYISNALYQELKKRPGLSASYICSQALEAALKLPTPLPPTEPRKRKSRTAWTWLTEDDVAWIKQARKDHELEMQSLKQRFHKKGSTA